MGKYIWQSESWPRFRWKAEGLLNPLAQVRALQGFLVGRADSLGLENQSDLIVEEAFTTSAIEGETLDREALRSSVAGRLGLPRAGLPSSDRKSDALVEMLLDATGNYSEPLTAERIWGWHAALFPTGYSGTFKIHTGGWRNTDRPMRVVSGSMGKEKIHFEAPPSENIPDEMVRFIRWWNNPEAAIDGILRAAVAHLYFVTIHPFDDGNGRIARALSDMALAQEEKTRRRLYSVSSRIIKDRKMYYTVLEKTQKGDGEVTDWLIWFLETLKRSMEDSRKILESTAFSERFYRRMAAIVLNDRQRKLLLKMLDRRSAGDEIKITNRGYVALTGGSPETAKRDLKDLVEKGLLIPGPAAGRSTDYRLPESM